MRTRSLPLRRERGGGRSVLQRGVPQERAVDGWLRLWPRRVQRGRPEVGTRLGAAKSVVLSMLRHVVGRLAICLFLACFASPAQAAPTVIARLGAAPLLGSSASTAQLRARVDAAGSRVALAAAELGLSDSEYRAFRTALFSHRLPWGILPRHLDAMAFYRADGVHVLHDVLIPVKTFGWEVDIAEAGQTVRVIVPATCGNLSVLRAFHPAIASHPAQRVAASVEHAAPATPTPSATQSPSPAPSASASPQSTETPAPSPSPTTVASETPPPPTHHMRWPWAIPIVLLFFFHGGSHGGSSPPPSGGGCGCGCIPPLP